MKIAKRQRIDEDGLRKSFYNEDEIRIRFLRRKENNRWKYLELPSKNGNYYAKIYTVEQALERDIEFRKDWQKPSEVKRNYYSDYVYSQKEDWVITEATGPLDEFWVMQVLWRNEYPTFNYIRTATGTYVIDRSKLFDGFDIQGQFTAGGNLQFYGSGKRKALNERQKLLAMFIACLVKEYGVFNRDVVRIAYTSAYSGRTLTWHQATSMMESEKIMAEVAKTLKELLGNEGADDKFVIQQLKEMASKDYDREPTRRERTLRLIGAMNELPTYKDKAIIASIEPNNLGQLGSGKPVDAEEVEIKEDMSKVDG